MTKQEFEALYGSKVTDEQYGRAERIYMATDNTEKDQLAREYQEFHLGYSAVVLDLVESYEKLHHDNQDLLDRLVSAHRDADASSELMAKLSLDNNSLGAEQNKLTEQKIELALVLLRNGLDTEAIGILGHEYVIAFQLATSFTERFGFPQDRRYLEPLLLAFENGISFARAWAKLTPEQRRQTEEYYSPLAKEMFGDNDKFNTSLN